MGWALEIVIKSYQCLPQQCCVSWE